ncbi:hypothetical protein HPB51_025066 [Rhipicephalus microplus]|uniref:Uncharacterized protein n=1 Tax=Rhipicephalus microplus TaxID=6941 RepID=A0A9J6DK48_RHIMP|nr:hypothetical protein HPB51_025066 [Rhipicephalus microplus]
MEREGTRSSSVQVFGSSFFDSRRRAPWVLLYGAISLAGTMLIIVMLVFLFGRMRPIPRRTEKSKLTFCCPHVLERVYGEVNFHRDPCENVLDYACTGPSRPAIRRGDIDQSSTALLPGDPTYTNPVTAAGMSIEAYYKACLQQPYAKEPCGYLAAKAVLEVAAAEAFMPAESLLRLVFELSMKYDLPSLLDIRVETGNSDIYAYLSVAFPSLGNVSQTPDGLRTVKLDSLSVINEALGTGVKLSDADVFFNILARANANKTETSTLDDLQHAVPSITPTQWKNITDRFFRSDKISNIVGVPLHELQKHINEWIRYDAEPNIVTLALLGASVHLASRITMVKDEQEVKVFCESAVKELRPLWALKAVTGGCHFPPQALNKAIESVYWHVLRRVLRIVSFTMVKSDRDDLTRKLVRMRLLFPSDVAPAELPIPTLTQDFARAYVAGRGYIFGARRHQAEIVGVARDFMGELEKATIFATADTITIPTRIYASLMMFNTTEELLLMPTVGVRMANVIWQAVLTGNWSLGSRTLLRIYVACIKDKVKAISSTHAAFSVSHWLSLETVVEAAREEDWNARVDGSGNLTFSQLFYAMYVQHHFCGSLLSDDSPKFVERANALISSFPDFVSSFNCGKRLRSEVTVCLQHLFSGKKYWRLSVW